MRGLYYLPDKEPGNHGHETSPNQNQSCAQQFSKLTPVVLVQQQ